MVHVFICELNAENAQFDSVLYSSGTNLENVLIQGGTSN